MDAVSFGIGIAIALLALSPALRWAYQAERRERKAERAKELDEREWSVANRVLGLLADMKRATDAADRAQVPSRVGRPSQEVSDAEALLMRFATARAAMEDYEKLLIYVKQHGGSPDDSPAKVMQTMSRKDTK